MADTQLLSCNTTSRLRVPESVSESNLLKVQKKEHSSGWALASKGGEPHVDET